MPNDEASKKCEPLEKGDCIAEHLGKIELTDGRIFHGLILTFPAGPPSIPIAAVWERLPLVLSLKSKIND